MSDAKKHIVSLSGGKDSTAMLLLMLERGDQIDRIVNVDTTKEFPEMYAHLRALEEYIGIEIETVKMDFDYWFSEHIKTRGKNKGQVGYAWPDFRNRWCTSLKRRAASHLIAQKPYNPRRWFVCKNPEGVVEYHGIAADEQSRANNYRDGREKRYPLIEMGITEADALSICLSHGFDWDGLYEEFDRLSCYCCPLSRIGELRQVYQNHKPLWNNMKEMDKQSWRSFRSGYTLDELEQRFSEELS